MGLLGNNRNSVTRSLARVSEWRAMLRGSEDGEREEGLELLGRRGVVRQWYESRAESPRAAPG